MPVNLTFCERTVITEYEVSLAVPSDARGISVLSRNAIEHGLSWSWTPRRVMYSIADASTNVIVIRQEGSLLGFAIMKYGEEEAHMHLLAVKDAYRRKGVGSALLSWLETTARVAGIGLIRLQARAQNVGARSFYRAHGFKELGLHVGYYQGVEDAVFMSKNLASA
jgi:ribosomal-protein-alanine N-acetyltransferase